MGKYRGNIYLIGFMGCGKSTVSNFLSLKLGIPEIDTDIRIEEEQGLEIADIFDKYGEDYFRGLENKLLEKMMGEKNCIVACGGGMAVRDDNVVMMKKSGIVVMLTAEAKTIYNRVSHSDSRPLLKNHMDIEYIKELMSKRIDAYTKAADIIIRTDEFNPREIAEQISRRIMRA